MGPHSLRAWLVLIPLLAAVTANAQPIPGNAFRQVELTPDDRHGNLAGSAVAIYDTVLVIGAPDEEACYVYEFSYDRGTWAQAARLTASDGLAGDGFGSAVAIFAYGWIIVGAPRANNSRGAAYVFRQSEWIQYAKLTAADGSPNAAFGAAVAMSGGWDSHSNYRLIVLVGAPNETVDSPRQGAVYVFEREGASPGVFYLRDRLVASDASADSGFGTALAMGLNATSRDYYSAVVGAPTALDGDRGPVGAAYVFQRTDPNASLPHFTEQAKLVERAGGGAASYAGYGRAVAIELDLAFPAILVGSPSADGASMRSARRGHTAAFRVRSSHGPTGLALSPPTPPSMTASARASPSEIRWRWSARRTPIRLPHPSPMWGARIASRASAERGPYVRS
jgi:hypothetical protein